MIARSTRACEPRDLRAVTHGRGSPWRNILQVALPISIVIGVLVYGLSRSLIAAVALGSPLLLASAWSNLSFFRGVERRQRSGSADDSVIVWDVEAETVVEIEHLGSNGPAWVFFSGDGRALLLIGQWLLEKRSFPTLEFRLSCWDDDGEPIRIDSRGKRVHPTEVGVALRGEHRFGSVQLLRARIETLQQDLDAALG